MSERITGGQALARSLKRHGISELFALPGLQLDHLFNALHDEPDLSPRVIHSRHEQGAAYMAFGAAQSTGRPSAFAVVPGPGFLNACAALATAYACNAPVLAISGQILLEQIGRGVGWLHELPDQLAIAKGLSKSATRIEHPAQIPAAVSEAIRAMTSGRPRPAYIEVPMDVLGRMADVDFDEMSTQRLPAALDEDALKQAAICLGTAKNPLILVGGGIFGATEELKALAEMLQAPVVMTRNAFGAVDCRHPLALTEPAGHRLWSEVDVALVVGTRFQMPTIGYARPNSAWGTGGGLKVIRIDIDPVEIARFGQPHIGLAADARMALASLLDGVPRYNIKRPARADSLIALKQALQTELEANLAPQMAYLQALRAELPEDGFFVEELTQIGYVARFAFPIHAPRTYVSTGYQGTLGFGFATALGVKVANPGRAVVSISGDGGFLFTAMELATAALHGIAIVAVVFNDNAFGNVRRMQREDHGGKVIASELRNPDFVKLTESFGLDAERVGDPGQLRLALRRALRRRTTSVIEVVTADMPDPWRYIRLPSVRPA